MVFAKARKEKSLLPVIYVHPVRNTITQGRRADGHNTRWLKGTIMMTVTSGDQRRWESKGAASISVEIRDAGRAREPQAT